jgi:hypothetical protein
MRWNDIVWELLDNALYLLHLAAVLLVLGAAIACPWLLVEIRRDLWAIRFETHRDLVALREVPPCECHCRHDDGHGPVLPRVLPRLRRIGEEAGE